MPTDAQLNRTIAEDGLPMMPNCNQVIDCDNEELVGVMKQIVEKRTVKGKTPEEVESNLALIKELAEIVSILNEEELQEQLDNPDSAEVNNIENHRCDCVGECHCDAQACQAGERQTARQPTEPNKQFRRVTRNMAAADSSRATTPGQTVYEQFQEAARQGEREGLQNGAN